MIEIVKNARIKFTANRPDYLNVEWDKIGIGDGFQTRPELHDGLRPYAYYQGAKLGRKFQVKKKRDQLWCWRIS